MFQTRYLHPLDNLRIDMRHALHQPEKFIFLPDLFLYYYGLEIGAIAANYNPMGSNSPEKKFLWELIHV